MWPFSEMSLSTATWLSDFANLALLLSLIAGVISTFAIVRLGNVKEHHWDVARDQSRERIAELQTDLGKAQAAIADANARTLEAQLALEKFKAPRKLSPAQEEQLSERLRPFGQIPFDFSITPDPEAVDLMNQLASALTAAGWVWKEAPAIIVFEQSGKPNVGMHTSSGLQTQIDQTKLPDWERPVTALSTALTEGGIENAPTALLPGIVNANAVHIRIGRKP